MQGLGDGSDLVHLDQDGIGHAFCDAFTKYLLVGHEQIVSDQLDPLTQAVGQSLPTLPIVLGHPVLDRDQRITLDEPRQIIHHLRRVQLAAFEVVLPLPMELGGGHVEGKGDLLADPIPGHIDGLHEQFQRSLIGGQIGGESPFIADVGPETTPGDHLLEGVVDLDPGAKRLGVGGEAGGHHHELLDVDRVGSMCTAIEHVETGHRKHLCSRATEVPVERKSHGG